MQIVDGLQKRCATSVDTRLIENPLYGIFVQFSHYINYTLAATAHLLLRASSTSETFSDMLIARCSYTSDNGDLNWSISCIVYYFQSAVSLLINRELFCAPSGSSDHLIGRQSAADFIIIFLDWYQPSSLFITHLPSTVFTPSFNLTSSPFGAHAFTWSKDRCS